MLRNMEIIPNKNKSVMPECFYRASIKYLPAAGGDSRQKRACPPLGLWQAGGNDD